MNKIKLKILSILFASLLTFVSFNNSKADILDYYDSQKEIYVIIGETKSIGVKNPIQVKIGNPGLLDVISASKKELLLDGKKAGETLLTIMDDFGRQTYTVKVFDEDLEKFRERVDVLLRASGFGQLKTQIGDKERKIFVTGELPVSKQEELEKKLEIVKDGIVNLVFYNQDVPSVEIDVEVLEIEKTDLDNLGFQWNKTIAFEEGTLGKAYKDLIDPTKALKVLETWRTSNFETTLNLLKSRSKARTLSRPKIVCLSGKEAKLLVGGERPIITGSTTTAGSGSSTTDYDIELKEYGIKLNIKPIVQDNDIIQVSLSVEITEVDETNQLELSSGVTTPGFTERSAETELSVQSGKTVFLAGLIKSAHQDNKDQVAGLGSLPFFGPLFRHKDLQQRDTEIVITLTPTIMRNSNQQASLGSSAVGVTFSSQRSKDIESPAIEKSHNLREVDPVLDYSALIQNIITSNLKYPKELKPGRIEGAVKLSLHLLSSGKLLGVVLMQSSGSKLLDDTIEQTVKKLSPFPAFPSDVKLKELWVDIPIVYEAS